MIMEEYPDPSIRSHDNVVGSYGAGRGVAPKIFFYVGWRWSEDLPQVPIAPHSPEMMDVTRPRDSLDTVTPRDTSQRHRGTFARSMGEAGPLDWPLAGYCRVNPNKQNCHCGNYRGLHQTPRAARSPLGEIN